MPRKALPTNPNGSKVAGTKEKGKPVTFTAVAVSRDEMPAPAKRGGRTSNVPAIQGFLDSIPNPGTYEMRSADDDGGHPVNRISQIRKVVEADSRPFKVETSPLESGKRYRVFITLDPPAA